MKNVLGSIVAGLQLNNKVILDATAEEIRKGQGYITKNAYDSLSKPLKKAFDTWAIASKFIDKDGNITFVGEGEGREKFDWVAIFTKYPTLKPLYEKAETAKDAYNAECERLGTNFRNQFADKRVDTKQDVLVTL